MTDPGRLSLTYSEVKNHTQPGSLSSQWVNDIGRATASRPANWSFLIETEAC